MMRPSAPRDDNVLPPGTRVGGHFVLEALLGRGGMAIVYRACDERGQRKLALKRLFDTAGIDSDTITALFEREYYTLCQLAHPRIVTVYDYGLDDGVPFYTMELLDGDDLSARRKWPWQQACALLRDVASSLAIIHSRRLVHRDISLRNVRCTSDGRAKLIDFGAMAPMGAVKQVVGTPPFVSPEALQLQALDGRVDLYALGVLAYSMLTGYYPYHARSLAQLKTLWRSPPYGPRRYQPEVPPALDSLVMQLLELERSARPGSAAEVMERLSGIAGLPLAELPEVRRAYLATPMLIGRQPLLDQVRDALLQSQHDQGSCFLIEGPSGMGRSRVLDACVLEAKIQGTLLLRADAADSGDDYSLMRALCAQLVQQVPELCEHSTDPRRALLGHVLPELGSGSELPEPAPDRPALQAALCEFIVSVARARPLVIAIDDLDKVDEASAAVIGALAQHAKPIALCLLLTVETAAAQGPALALTRQAATPLLLEPLSGFQTEALLRSLFGDVAHVAGLSERVQRVAEGNPRWTMSVAEQLVEHSVARYEAGSWALPAELKPGVLPQYMAAALWRRLSALSPDARELGEALALTEPAMLNVAQYRLLTDHGDAARVYQALDALVAAGILIAEGNRYRLGQQGLRELLSDGQPKQRAQQAHARIARALEHGQHPLQLAYHRMLGGQEREALAALLPLSVERRPLGTTSFEVGLLERAVATAQRLGLPLRDQLTLRERLFAMTATFGLPQAAHIGAELVEQYDRDSGLSDCRTLEPELSAELRAARGIELARQRYAATEESARGLPPEEAMTHLAFVCSFLVGFTAIAEDLAPLERLPSLLPLCGVSPQLAVVRLQIEMQSGVISGRHEHALVLCEQIVQRLDRPDHGFAPAFARVFRLGIVYLIGLFAAGGGSARTREWVAELQSAPGFRANAWRVRMVYELMHGNQEAAGVCQRRAELLELQDTGAGLFPGTTTNIELIAAIYADDLMGVKRISERLEELAARHPNRRPALCVARSHYRRLRGDLQGALQALAPALAMAVPGRHRDWPMLVAAEVDLRASLGDAHAATELGLQHIATCVRNRQWSGYQDLLFSVAHAAMQAGRLEQALGLMNHYLERQEALQTRGIALGRSYELRARLAVAMRDQVALQHYFNLCAQQYAAQRDGTLGRKYERLKAEADAAGLSLAPHARVAFVSDGQKRRAPRIAELLVESS